MLFLGSKKAGLLALRRLLMLIPKGCMQAILCPNDKIDNRSEYHAFQSLAHEYGLALHLVQSGKEMVELIRHFQPHTAMVHGWYRMIPIAEFPSTDFLGFHFSPLPQYRGNAPLVWQIINGEQRLGVTFFTLSEGMDDGDLVDQRFFELNVHEDISDAIEKANQQVMNILDEFIPKWLTGNVVRQKQSQVNATYCGVRFPQDGLVDWHCPARVVHNFIRAQARPYPGAFSRLSDGRVVRFWKTEIEPRTFYGVPGSVVDFAPDSITVACGAGAIKILRAEVETEPDISVGALRSLKVRFS